jgi:hypothetical protein
MACDWVQSTWNWAVSGGPAVSVSVNLSFPPASLMIAQTALANAQPEGGIMFSGISGYRTRPDPNGGDQDHPMSWDTNFGYPAMVWANNMSGVTGEMSVGGEFGSGSFHLTVFYLS